MQKEGEVERYKIKKSLKKRHCIGKKTQKSKSEKKATYCVVKNDRHIFSKRLNSFFTFKRIFFHLVRVKKVYAFK
jgi:hypothetical protein